MHRIASRSLHVRSKIHWRVWPIPESRPQKSFEHRRRQFHVSSPKQSFLPKPSDVEGINSIVLGSDAESITNSASSLTELVPGGDIVLPLAIAWLCVLPHFFRYKFDIRAWREKELQSGPARRLLIIHEAVLNQRHTALLERSTAASSKEIEQLEKRRKNFYTRLLRHNYKLPYSTWERQTLIPPALHIAWTTFVVFNVLPGLPLPSPESISVGEVVTEPTITELLSNALYPIILVCLFVNYVPQIPFWRSFDPYHVARMRPWLRKMLGLNKPIRVPGELKIMPQWINLWDKQIDMPNLFRVLPMPGWSLGLRFREKFGENPLKSCYSVYFSSTRPVNSVQVAQAYSLVSTVVWFAVLSPCAAALYPAQAMYLIAGLLASCYREFALSRWKETQAETGPSTVYSWGPRTPRV